MGARVDDGAVRDAAAPGRCARPLRQLSIVPPEDQHSEFALILDAWASSIANLQTPLVPVVKWPAERARRHGLSYPTDPHAALAARIVGLLESGPQSSTSLASRLDVEEHAVAHQLRRLREDGDVVLTLPKLWRLTG